MDHILQTILNYWQVHHDAIMAVVVPGGALLSIGVQWFLHKFKISGPRLAFAISHVFALATAAATYFLDSVHPNVGFTYGWLWIASQFWHRYTVNPAYNKYVLPFLSWLSKQKTTDPLPSATTDSVTDSDLE